MNVLVLPGIAHLLFFVFLFCSSVVAFPSLEYMLELE